MKTSYPQLRELFTDKVKDHAKGITLLDVQATHGYSFELWGTIESNEVHARFFIVCPGMNVLHVYLSDFKQMLRDQDKIVTDVIEGAIYGQALHTFRMLIAMIEDSISAEFKLGTKTIKPMDLTINAIERLRRSYRHVLYMDNKLVSGALIKPKG